LHSRLRCLKGSAEQLRDSDFSLHHLLTKRFRLPSRRKACTPRPGAGYLPSRVDSCTLLSARTREATTISSFQLYFSTKSILLQQDLLFRMDSGPIHNVGAVSHAPCRDFRADKTVYLAQKGITILFPPNSPANVFSNPREAGIFLTCTNQDIILQTL